MPKSKLNSKTLYLPTENVYREVTNKDGSKSRRLAGKKLKLDVLTEDIINTGNLEMLEEFYDQHREELSGNEKEEKYLQSRIKGAQQIERIKQESLETIADGRPVETPSVDVSQDSYEGFSDLKYPGPQSSGNGCWSCAYSLLLKSRGVDLSQEYVRSWRPDYDKNTAKEDKANPGRQYSLNTDSVNSVFENADLLATVLPNTGMKQITITPADTNEMTIGGKPLTGDQADIVDKYYRAQAKEILRDTITNAIKVNKSPVATVYNGHYVTITGIAPDGRIRIEDSRRSLSEPTQHITLDDLINDSFSVNRNNQTTRSVGLQLTWLQDLDTPAYDKKAEEKTELRKNEPDLVKTDASGNVSIEVPLTHPTSSATGSPKDGYVIGSNITTSLKLDQSGLEQVLGGRIENFEKGEYHMGSADEYYPKKVYFKGDPELKKQAEQYRKQNLLKDSSLYEYAASDLRESPEPGLDQYNKSVEKFSDALFHISEVIADSNIRREPLKKDTIAKDIETLKGLQDFLCKEQENGKTGLENVEGYISSVDHQRAHKRLRDISEAFPEIGLDVDAAIASTEKSKQQRRERGELIESYNETVAHNANLRGSMIRAERAQTPEERQLHLSEAAARYLLWMERRMEGEGSPSIAKEDVQKRAESIRKSEVFQNVMADGNDVKLADKKDITALMDELSTEYQVVKEKEKEKNLAAEKVRKKEEHKSRIYAKIAEKKGAKVLDEATSLRSALVGAGVSQGTGKYWGGIISRRKNSDEYEKMLGAINTFDTKPNSRTLRETVDAVMDYLKGKEKPRKSGTGQERWNRCMNFLAAAMPRNEFETYCNQINKIRKAEPGSDNYVSSEQFHADGFSVRSNINAVKSRISTGDVTKRDFARIIALHELYDEPVEQDGEYKDQDDFMEMEVDRKKLAEKTTEIMKRADFKNLMKLPAKELKQLVDKNGCMRLKDYRSLAPKEPEKEQLKNGQIANNAQPAHKKDAKVPFHR